jgi:AcrR family transcriptional regulator
MVTEEKTATSGPRPLRADARRNRERVLVAARKVLAEEGFDAQMTEIAEKAGVGIGTLYRHFPDKTALIEALVAERFREFAELARGALAADDAWEGFRAWLMGCGEIQARDRMICDYLAETLGGERVEAIANQVGLTEITEEVVAHAKREGAIRDAVVPQDIPTMMCGLGAIARRRDGSEDAAWHRHLDFMLAGMRNPQ